jgi:hypothetical protein
MMPKKNIVAIALMVLCLIISSCSTLPPAVPVEYANVCKKENDKKRVEVAGYLGLGGGDLYCPSEYGVRMCYLSLYEKPDTKPDNEHKGITAKILIGSVGSTMNEPRQSVVGISNSDLVIREDNGTNVTTKDKLKLSATVTVTDDIFDKGKTVCYLMVDKIEKQ